VVAPGYTVMVGEPSRQVFDKKTRVWNGEMTDDTTEIITAGNEVELSAADHRRLTSMGYLLNPDGSQSVPFGVGPDYDVDHTKDTNPAAIGFHAGGVGA
jgi:hypothetical protein